MSPHVPNLPKPSSEGTVRALSPIPSLPSLPSSQVRDERHRRGPDQGGSPGRGRRPVGHLAPQTHRRGVPVSVPGGGLVAGWDIGLALPPTLL